MQRPYAPSRFPAFVAAASAAIVTVALAGLLDVGFGPLPAEAMPDTEVAGAPIRIEVIGVRDARADNAFDAIVPTAAAPLLPTVGFEAPTLRTSAVAGPAPCNS